MFEVGGYPKSKMVILKARSKSKSQFKMMMNQTFGKFGVPVYRLQPIGFVKHKNHATVFLNTQEVRDYVKECTGLFYHTVNLPYDSDMYLMLKLKFEDVQ